MDMAMIGKKRMLRIGAVCPNRRKENDHGMYVYGVQIRNGYRR